MKGVVNLAHFFATHPITSKAPYWAWARFIRWQLRSRIQREIVVSWIAGQRLVVRRGMTGATGNIYAGLHEFVDMILPLHFLRSGDLFFDVGANVGSYTVLASGVSGTNTWAFEPDPDALDSLRRNINVNNLWGLIKVYDVALGETESRVPFTVGRDTTNKVAMIADENVRIVRQMTLDSLTAHAKPIMIKIDVEGYEEQVIRGALELETITPYINQVLRSGQFEKAYYDPFTRRLQRHSAGTTASSNHIFVRDWDFVSSRLAAAKPIDVFDNKI
jgi:FkbM family methyltransferase